MDRPWCTLPSMPYTQPPLRGRALPPDGIDSSLDDPHPAGDHRRCFRAILDVLPQVALARSCGRHLRRQQRPSWELGASILLTVVMVLLLALVITLSSSPWLQLVSASVGLSWQPAPWRWRQLSMESAATWLAA